MASKTTQAAREKMIRDLNSMLAHMNIEIDSRRRHINRLAHDQAVAKRQRALYAEAMNSLRKELL